MSLNRGVGNSQRALSMVEEGKKGGGSQLREVRPGVFALLWALDLTLKVVPSLKMEGQSLCPGRGRSGGDRQGLASVIHYSEPIFSPPANFPGPVCSGELDAVSCRMFYSFS